MENSQGVTQEKKHVNVMILNLSLLKNKAGKNRYYKTYKPEGKKLCYKEEGKKRYYTIYNNERKRVFFDGISQQEPCTKCVIKELRDKENPEKLDKIIVLASWEAENTKRTVVEREKKITTTINNQEDTVTTTTVEQKQKLVSNTTLERYKMGIKAYIKELWGEEGKEDLFLSVALKPVAEAFVKLREELVTLTKDENGETQDVHVYVDMGGGQRSYTYAMNAILELLREQENIIIKEKLVTDFVFQRPMNPVVGVTEYELMDMVSGMKAFLEYGKADLLVEYFEKHKKPGKDKLTEDLLNIIVEISDSIQVCMPDKFEDAIGKLATFFKENQGKEESQRWEYKILVEDIRKSYGKLAEKKITIDNDGKQVEMAGHTIVDSIDWCQRNGFLQQAMVLYTEKLPSMYFDEGWLKEEYINDVANKKNAASGETRLYPFFIEKTRTLVDEKKITEDEFDKQLRKIIVEMEKVPQSGAAPKFIYHVTVPADMEGERRNRLIEYIKTRDITRPVKSFREIQEEDKVLYLVEPADAQAGNNLKKIVTLLLSGSDTNWKKYILTGESETNMNSTQRGYLLKIEELGLLDRCKESDERADAEKRTSYLAQMTDLLSYDQLKELFFYTMLIKIYRNQMSHANGETEWDEKITKFYAEFYKDNFNEESPDKVFTPVVSKKAVSHALEEAVAFHRRVEKTSRRILDRLEKEGK